MPQSTQYKFLVSPLEWGLGHATRLSKIIHFLLQQNHEVVIAADGLPFNFLHREFPKLTIERLPLKQIKYARSRGGFFVRLIIQMPGFFLSIRKSKRTINDLVVKHNVDFIISDNRYGFIHPKIPSVFITHQLRPMPPKYWRWGQSTFGRFHLWLLRKYSFIWVADFHNSENVVGRLSRIPWHNPRLRFIGPQSWLKKYEGNALSEESTYDILVMLSGPEPHRTELETRLIDQLGHLKDKKIIILQGLPPETVSGFSDKTQNNIRIVNHLPGNEIFKLIKNTEHIICRAGVVTVFDLAVLQRSAVLIPTPGQTEQEYVAEYLEQKGFFTYLDQSEITLEKLQYQNHIRKKTFRPNSDQDLLLALTELLQQV